MRKPEEIMQDFKTNFPKLANEVMNEHKEEKSPISDADLNALLTADPKQMEAVQKKLLANMENLFDTKDEEKTKREAPKEPILTPISKDEFKKKFIAIKNRWNELEKRRKELNIIYCTADFDYNAIAHQMKMAVTEYEYARIIYHLEHKLALFEDVIKAADAICLDFDKIAEEIEARKKIKYLINERKKTK